MVKRRAPAVELAAEVPSLSHRPACRYVDQGDSIPQPLGVGDKPVGDPLVILTQFVASAEVPTFWVVAPPDQGANQDLE